MDRDSTKGGEDGQRGHGLEKALGRYVDPGDGIGKDIADEGGDDGHNQAQRHGAAEDLAVPGRLQDGDEIAQRERAGLVGKAVDQRFGQRIDDEQQQQREREDDGNQQQGLAQNHLRFIEALCAGSGICHERSS